MNSIKYIRLAYKGLFLFLMFIGAISQATADEALGSSIDCSEVSINYTDNPEWSHSERLEAMDKAFFNSVNRFELCNLSNQSGASPSSTTDSEGGDREDSSSDSEGELGLNSTASSEMTGTEIESTPPPMNSPENAEPPEGTLEGPITTGGGNVSNGSIPEDIPNADNDDVIAAQIRLAAEIETDPIKKEKLWNEYRKYKGLPANE